MFIILSTIPKFLRQVVSRAAYCVRHLRGNRGVVETVGCLATLLRERFFPLVESSKFACFSYVPKSFFYVKYGSGCQTLLNSAVAGVKTVMIHGCGLTS